MSALLAFLIAHLGRTTDAASAAGSLAARILETLNRFTPTIAGRIDVSVSSRLSGTIIASIQRGTITTSGVTTATISSVSTSKANVRWIGSSWRSGIYQGRYNAVLDLQNSTTVRSTPNASGGQVFVSFEVTERK